MKLYSRNVSPADQMVRLALLFKNIDDVMAESDTGVLAGLHYQGGVHESLVLDTGDEQLTQAMAILEYLEDICPEPALLPDPPLVRARVRSFSQLIFSDIQPYAHARVSGYMENHLQISREKQERWFCHWLETGLARLEFILAHQAQTGTYCFGEQITMADLVLVPLVMTTGQLDIDMRSFPHISRIVENCMELELFRWLQA